MASSINASTTAGVVTTADTSGVLNIQTAGTTAISIDASQAVSFTNAPTVTGGTANGVAYLNGSKVLTTGSALVFDGTNLGVGVTPSAWTFSSLSIGGQAASFAGDVNTVYAQANAYYNAGWKYVGTGYAGQYQIDRSVTALHKWYTAASGTAGNPITFGDPKMTLDASGNLLVGTTSASGAGASSGLQVINFDGAAGNGLYMSDTRTSAGTDNVVIFGRGATYVGKIETTLTTTNYISPSDYRLKNVTGSLAGYKERLMSLQPKQGTWIVDGSEFRGFLAHNFAVSYPKSVSGEKDAVDANGKPMLQGIQASTSEVIADLVALLQEQQALITQLQADVAALKGA